MRRDLDNVLRHLFLAQVPGLMTESQVRFQPPDDRWRAAVANLTAAALNVYLVELRENRGLRSNERVRQIDNGVSTFTVAPPRVDCHYLLSAWSPAQDAPGVEPTLDEHNLIYQTTAGLLNVRSLVPRAVDAPDPRPAGLPD